MLVSTPGIREAAVVGAPDERLGEVPVAFVAGETHSDLEAVCRRHLIPYKVPVRFENGSTGFLVARPARCCAESWRTGCDRPGEGSRPPIDLRDARGAGRRPCGVAGVSTGPRPATPSTPGCSSSWKRPGPSWKADTSVRAIVNTGNGELLPDRARYEAAVHRPRGAAGQLPPQTRDFALRDDLVALRRDQAGGRGDLNGTCAGGGLHFVAEADIVIAAEDATFLDPQCVGRAGVGVRDDRDSSRRLPWSR